MKDDRIYIDHILKASKKSVHKWEASITKPLLKIF